MRKYEFTVMPAGAGSRLDVYLVDEFGGGLSRTYIKKLIDGKKVAVNGVFHKAHYIIQLNDKIFIEVPDPDTTDIKPENIPLDIKFEDDHVIVVNKPAGLVVHPAPGHYTGTLVNALLYHCGELSAIGGEYKPGIVHRLDQDTTGLIIAAKNDSAHRSLAEQFKTREAGRVYIALVKGVVQLDNGIIELPIARHKIDRKRMDVEFVDGRDACTIYKVLRRFEDFTMLELKLATGRTHQIRVHLSHIGYPIIGDKTYGLAKGLNRQALHAKMLSFVHPVTGKRMEIDSELPKDMQEVIKRGKI